MMLLAENDGQYLIFEDKVSHYFKIETSRSYLEKFHEEKITFDTLRGFLINWYTKESVSVFDVKFLQVNQCFEFVPKLFSLVYFHEGFTSISLLMLC